MEAWEIQRDTGKHLPRGGALPPRPHWTWNSAP